MTNLVIGLGEIGTAIQKILECDGTDEKKGIPTLGVSYDVIHVCFPYSDEFIAAVREYEQIFKSKLTVVHSTVPVGTCDQLEAVHSPCRGVHPELEKGIRTFVKFFGGSQAFTAAGIFREKGLQTMCTAEARETEALKLWDTTIYGWNILIQKAIKKYCDVRGLDFAVVYKLANSTYNEGYEKLGHPEYKKYILNDRPGPIGGHCVKENWELLDDVISAVSQNLHAVISD